MAEPVEVPRSFAEMTPEGATRASELSAGYVAGLDKGRADAAARAVWLPTCAVAWVAFSNGTLARRPSCAWSEGFELGYVAARPNPYADAPPN